MGPAEKHNMSYQTPIFPFLPPHRLSISLQLSIMWNTGRDKALWSCGSDGRTSSPATWGTCSHTHTHTDKTTHTHIGTLDIHKRSSLLDSLLCVSKKSSTHKHSFVMYSFKQCPLNAHTDRHVFAELLTFKSEMFYFETAAETGHNNLFWLESSSNRVG